MAKIKTIQKLATNYLEQFNLLNATRFLFLAILKQEKIESYTLLLISMVNGKKLIFPHNIMSKLDVMNL